MRNTKFFYFSKYHKKVETVDVTAKLINIENRNTRIVGRFKVSRTKAVKIVRIAKSVILAKKIKSRNFAL